MIESKACFVELIDSLIAVAIWPSSSWLSKSHFWLKSCLAKAITLVMHFRIGPSNPRPRTSAKTIDTAVATRLNRRIMFRVRLGAVEHSLVGHQVLIEGVSQIGKDPTDLGQLRDGLRGVDLIGLHRSVLELLFGLGHRVEALADLGQVLLDLGLVESGGLVHLGRIDELFDLNGQFEQPGVGAAAGVQRRFELGEPGGQLLGLGIVHPAAEGRLLGIQFHAEMERLAIGEIGRSGQKDRVLLVEIHTGADDPVPRLVELHEGDLRHGLVASLLGPAVGHIPFALFLADVHKGMKDLLAVRIRVVGHILALGLRLDRMEDHVVLGVVDPHVIPVARPVAHRGDRLLGQFLAGVGVAEALILVKGFEDRGRLAARLAHLPLERIEAARLVGQRPGTTGWPRPGRRPGGSTVPGSSPDALA